MPRPSDPQATSRVTGSLFSPHGAGSSSRSPPANRPSIAIVSTSDRPATRIIRPFSARSTPTRFNMSLARSTPAPAQNGAPKTARSPSKSVPTGPTSPAPAIPTAPASPHGPPTTRRVDGRSCISTQPRRPNPTPSALAISSSTQFGENRRTKLAPIPSTTTHSSRILTPHG